MLLEPFDLGPGRRLSVDQFAFGVKRLVAHRIPSGKAAEIDLAAALQFLPQRLYPADVTLLGGADEIIVADVEEAGHVAPGRRDAVAEFLRRQPESLRRAFDLLAVLVAAGEEFDPAPVEPHEPRQHIAHHGRVRVAE